MFFVTKPSSSAGFGEPDMGAGYVPIPGDEPVRPTLHFIYATQQEDSIKAHVETELMPVTKRLREAGYQVSIMVGFSKDPANDTFHDSSLDYGFVSGNIADLVRAAWIDNEAQGSDHQPFWFELDL